MTAEATSSVWTLIDEPQAVLEGRRSAPRDLARLGREGAQALVGGFARFQEDRRAAGRGVGTSDDREVYEAFEVAACAIATEHPALVLELAGTSGWPSEWEGARQQAAAALASGTF